MKRTIFPILLLLSCSIVSSASESDSVAEEAPIEIQQGHGIVRALIENPEIAEMLNQEYLNQVYKMTREELEPGITRYMLEVSTCGNCMPKKANVEIIEDMRPTYADGPIDYRFSISIDD